MATTQGSQSTSGVVTAPRAARLWKLLRYLGTRPQTRSALLKRLGMDIRGFYRDLEFLRRAGIEVVLREGRYRLVEGEEKAEGRLPLPDPHLTVAEALQLATGRSRVHRRLRDALAHLRPWKLVGYLGKGPQKREVLMRQLERDLRGFYRDLQQVRAAGIGIVVAKHGYSLTETLKSVSRRLLLPDPHWTLAEALVLATGRSEAHRKLRQWVAAIRS